MQQGTTYQLMFDDEAGREDFLRLLEFANTGAVITGWGDVDEDDEMYDPEGDNVYPLLDETDRTNHQWFALAYALYTVGMYDSIIVDRPTTGHEVQDSTVTFIGDPCTNPTEYLLVKTISGAENAEIVYAAAAQVGLQVC